MSGFAWHAGRPDVAATKRFDEVFSEHEYREQVAEMEKQVRAGVMALGWPPHMCASHARCIGNSFFHVAAVKEPGQSQFGEGHLLNPAISLMQPLPFIQSTSSLRARP